jgi:hypothetical protein
VIDAVSAVTLWIQTKFILGMRDMSKFMKRRIVGKDWPKKVISSNFEISGKNATIAVAEHTAPAGG